MLSKLKVSYVTFFPDLNSGLFISTHKRIICSRNFWYVNGVYNIVFIESKLVRFLKFCFGHKNASVIKENLSLDGVVYKNIFMKRSILLFILMWLSKKLKIKNSPLIQRLVISDDLIKRILPFFRNSDFIMSHWLFPSSCIANEISNALNIPYGITFHGSDINSENDYWGKNNWLFEVVKNSSVNVFVSHDLLLSASEKFPFNINGIVSKNSLLKDELITLENFNLEKKIDVVFVGNLYFVKGADRLFDIFIKLDRMASRQINFTIVGDGNYKCQLRTAFENKGLDVNFVGQVKSPDAIKIIAESKVLVLPSRSEGLPMVLLEAISLNTMVVATNVGGCCEVVDSLYLIKNDENINDNAANLIYNLLDMNLDDYNFKKITPLEDFVMDEIINIDNILK